MVIKAKRINLLITSWQQHSLSSKENWMNMLFSYWSKTNKKQINLSHLSDTAAAVAFEEEKQMALIWTSVCLLSSTMGDPTISSVLLSISLFCLHSSWFYLDKTYQSKKNSKHTVRLMSFAAALGSITAAI